MPEKIRQIDTMDLKCPDCGKQADTVWTPKKCRNRIKWTGESDSKFWFTTFYLPLRVCKHCGLKFWDRVSIDMENWIVASKTNGIG
jgi:hypothetical protein